MSASVPPTHRAALLAIAMLTPGLSGCDDDINTYYGRTGGYGGDSINGTAVLAEMFTQAGHRVRSWGTLSPNLNKADVIVWFPNDFQPPTPKVRKWLEKWLKRGGRTLIYVGRDYDAEALYWKTIQPMAPPGQQAEIRRRLGNAKSDFAISQGEMPATEDCQWFAVQGAPNPLSVKSLSGDWANGINASKVDIELTARLDPPPWATVMLETRGDAIVSRQSLDEGKGSELIVVSNGSFLLNLPLVNHEHRKLAGKLIDEVGESKSVVFLESGDGGPPIREEDPASEMPTGMEAFTIWPVNYLALHLAVLGLLFIFARWPIFGLPRHADHESPSDFGKHVTALGALLKKTQDQAYVNARLHHYQQTVRGDATGVEEHAKAVPP